MNIILFQLFHIIFAVMFLSNKYTIEPNFISISENYKQISNSSALSIDQRTNQSKEELIESQFLNSQENRIYDTYQESSTVGEYCTFSDQTGNSYRYWDPNGNHFECGECTWWASYSRPDIPSPWRAGDSAAHRWDDHASADSRFSVGNYPEQGAIAVWEQGCDGASSISGHVAYVTYVESDGSFYVSEMNKNYDGGLGWRGPISNKSCIDFIYGGVTLFEDHYFRGEWQRFRTDDSNITDLPWGVSSVYIPVHWDTILYKNANYDPSSYTHRYGVNYEDSLASSFWDLALDNYYNDESPMNDNVGSIQVAHNSCIQLPQNQLLTLSTDNSCNVSTPDSIPPDGEITTAPTEGSTYSSKDVHLEAWVSDDQSGINNAHLTAFFNGAWHPISPDYNYSPFNFDWDMCNDGVPDGQVVIGLDIWDKAGNEANSPRGIKSFVKNHECTYIPPQVSNWQVEYFNDTTLTNRCDGPLPINGTYVFQDWDNDSPTGNCNRDNWSARIWGKVHFTPGIYNFALFSDDWARLIIEGNMIIDNWEGKKKNSGEWQFTSEGDYGVTIEFADKAGAATLAAWWSGPGIDIPHDIQEQNTWFAQYWGNKFPPGDWAPVVHVNEDIGMLEHRWGDEGPGYGLPSDGFSSRFERWESFNCGVYSFTITSDDGVKLWIDDELQFESWKDQAETFPPIDVELSAGEHKLTIEHYENRGGAEIKLVWEEKSLCATCDMPAHPDLLTPQFGIRMNDDTPTFSWEMVTNATLYEFQIASDEDFMNLVQDMTFTETQYTSSTSLDDGVYWWRVRGTNDADGCNAVGNWNASVFILDTIPPNVHIVSPSNDAFIKENMISIEAEASDSGSGVGTVKFYVEYDNFWDFIGEDINGGDGWTFVWDAIDESDQRLRLKAEAIDPASNNATSNLINVSLDRTPPMSIVGGLPSQSLPTLTVSWSGTDNLAGISSYDVQYNDNEGAWIDWQQSVITTSAQFTGEPGHNYSFKSRAEDLAGNLEEWPLVPDTQTTIEIPHPGITFSPLTIRVTDETGTSDSFTVVLDSQPTADVTINLTNSDPTEGVVSPTSLIFTPGTWSLPQSVTVNGLDDPMDDGDVYYDILTDPAISNDPNYGGLNPANIMVKNLDDDDQGPMTGSVGLITTGDVDEVERKLHAWGYEITKLPVDSGLGDFQKYDVIYLPGTWASGTSDNYSIIESHAVDYRTFIAEGGGLMLDQPNPYLQPGESITPGLLPYQVTFNNWYNYNDWPPVLATSNHYIIDALSANDLPGPADQMVSLDPSYEILVRGSVSSSPSLVVATYGRGRILIQTDNAYKIGDEAYRRMVEWVKGVVPNDDFDNAEIINNLPYSNLQDSAGATSATDDPVLNCLGVSKYNSVWYRYIAAEDGRLTVDTFNSDYDTVLALWSGTRGNLNNIACNDDNLEYQSQISTNVTAGTIYFVEIAGYSKYSYGSLNLSAYFSPFPKAPTDLVATAISFDQIDLGWTDNGSDETGFEIERSLDGSSNWSVVDFLGPNSTSHSDAGLNSGITYYYRVRAFNEAGYSLFSDVASATTVSSPTAPSAMEATVVSQSQLDLVWADNSTNEDGFKLERSPDGNTSWMLITTLGANITSYSDTGLASGSTYYYRVRAFNMAGYSLYSNVANALTLSLPAAPSNLTATGISESQIELTWTDNSGNEEGSNLERSPNGVDGWTMVASQEPNSVSYTDTGLSPGITYNYRVCAFNGVGSRCSDIASANTPESPPSEDNFAESEVNVAGSVSGGYLDTHNNDGLSETITELESGGKPNKRYSYLEHKWNFNVLEGSLITFHANIWTSSSSDNDTFIMAFSTDDVTYTDMFTVTSTSDDASYQTYILPSSLSGPVYVRVKDTDQTSGNRSLDTLFIDHMFIRTDASPGNPPADPTFLVADTISSNQIDLTWTDNASDESGFEIERSLDGQIWEPTGTSGIDESQFTDLGLAADTNYFYRVRAYNASGQSGYSNSAQAMTSQAGTMHVGDLGRVSKINRRKWNAMVTITIHDVSENPVVGAAVSGVWSNGASGTDTCVTDINGQCTLIKSSLKASISSVTFSVSDVTQSGFVYQSVENHDPEGESDGTIITIFQ